MHNSNNSSLLQEFAGVRVHRPVPQPGLGPWEKNKQQLIIMGMIATLTYSINSFTTVDNHDDNEMWINQAPAYKDCLLTPAGETGATAAPAGRGAPADLLLLLLRLRYYY